MLQRVLARENVDERRRALFVLELLTKISIRLAPASRSVFDLFLKSANHPTFLRTGLPGIDQALNGGLHCRTLSEFVGTAGIGKSQAAMTLGGGVAKRLLGLPFIARIRQTYAGEEVDNNELAAAVIQRIRYVRVSSIATFFAKYERRLLLKVNILLVFRWMTIQGGATADYGWGFWASLPIACSNAFREAAVLEEGFGGETIVPEVEGGKDKEGRSSYALCQRRMLRLARDLKLFADTYSAFIVVTTGQPRLKAMVDCIIKPQPAIAGRTASPLGRLSWSSILCPFTVKEGGVEAFEDASEAIQGAHFDIVSDSNSDENHESFDWDIVTEE
ncbi:unnamed protein product [Peronospora destructor]|uniref:Uncharacterized protein n=1 Tax=Peronospora destructor TaxID=86335 RepID=A0AAV0TA46_9STRA|nr:unnamed protein product [Peronospora destructor]